MLSLKSSLSLADLSLRLGSVFRATFHRDGRTPESDATHTLMLAFFVLELAQAYPSAGLNRELLLRLALAHDLLEVETGDVCTLGASASTLKSKARTEEGAWPVFESDYGEDLPTVVNDLRRYERMDTLEAQVVKVADKILPKLTHALNRGATVINKKMSFEELWLAHQRQRQDLQTKFPAAMEILDSLFVQACEFSESSLPILRQHTPQFGSKRGEMFKRVWVWDGGPDGIALTHSGRYLVIHVCRVVDGDFAFHPGPSADGGSASFSSLPSAALIAGGVVCSEEPVYACGRCGAERCLDDEDYWELGDPCSLGNPLGDGEDDPDVTCGDLGGRIDLIPKQSSSWAERVSAS